MAVKIEQINVKDLGPITRFSHDFTQINLVFGHNEVGKTSLVEFVIRALFNNPKNWNLRRLNGKGKVLVSGLGESITEFQPESAKKIESYWETSLNEFPQDFAKLLVVRAAEVELTQEKSGVDSAILKKYLTGAGLLEKIVDKIPATIQAASIEKNVVLGSKRGDIKRISELQDEYSQLIDLEGRINEQLSEGRLLDLKNQKEKIETELSELNAAKRFRAFELHAKILELESEIEKYPEGDIDAAARKIGNWYQLRRFLHADIEKLETATKETEHFEWLKTAKEVFESRSIGKVPKNLKLFLIFGLLLLAGAAVSYFYFSYAFAAIFMSVFGAGSIGYFIYKQNRIIAFRTEVDDIKAVGKGYEERFSGTFHGLVDINTQITRIEPFYYEKGNLIESIKEKNHQLDRLEDEIKEILKKIHAQGFSFEKVEEIIQEIRDRKKKLTENKNKLANEFAVLQVDAEYFIDTKPKISWDLVKFEELLNRKDETEENHRFLEAAFSNLKQSARDIAGTDITDSWEDILWQIHERIVEKEQSIHTLHSQCVAQVLIYQITQELQISEEEKIADGIRASEIDTYIKKITNRYSGIDYSEGVISLIDDFGTYRLEDLSTGTIEQVFLSLRMGFASKIAEGEGLFLILDDAFQYSDWERRPRLVEQVIDLAKDGWQIIYFSMDNHIRDLFMEKAGKVFKKEFSLIEIENN